MEQWRPGRYGLAHRQLLRAECHSPVPSVTGTPELNVKLATLLGVVGGADGKPTTQSREVFASVSERVDAQLRRLDDLVEAGVPRFNALVRAQDLPALTLDVPQPGR